MYHAIHLIKHARIVQRSYDIYNLFFLYNLLYVYLNDANILTIILNTHICNCLEWYAASIALAAL